MNGIGVSPDEATEWVGYRGAFRNMDDVETNA